MSEDKSGIDWSAPAPRPVRLKWSAHGQSLAWVLIILGFSLPTAWAFTSEGAKMEALYRNGAVVTGQVLGGHIRSHKGYTHYWITYEYEVRGAKHWRDGEVSRYEYRRLERGDPITVTCLRSDPGVSVVGRVSEGRVEAARQFPWRAAVLGIAFVTVIGATIVSQEAALGRQLSLARSGTLIDAKVAEVRPLKSAARSVSYEFATPDGRTWRATKTAFGDAATALVDATEVPVLYDPGRPDRSDLLALVSAVVRAL